MGRRTIYDKRKFYGVHVPQPLAKRIESVAADRWTTLQEVLQSALAHGIRELEREPRLFEKSKNTEARE